MVLNNSDKKFLEECSNIPHQLRQYVRQSDNSPIGVVVAFKDKDGVVRLGWSKMNPKDSYQKELGLFIAYRRALSGKFNIQSVPRQMVDTVETIQERSSRYFK